MADAEPAAPERWPCPQCGASDATLSLLTSMHRYFACRRCNHRWQIAVTPDSAPPPAGYAETAATSRES